MIFNFKYKSPKIHETCYVAPTADIIGNVVIGKKSSIWPRAVVRGDVNRIEIGSYTNIQDGCILHVAAKYPIIIGSNVTVGHGSIVHGCVIEDYAFLGMGSIILEGAVIGEGVLIGAGALVSQGTRIPPYSLAMGMPAEVIKPLPQRYVDMVKKRGADYAKLAEEYFQLS
jgi:carbonic anhydrase/acetyltransferase-like protein (isoleucine patch superfamily)